MLNFKYFKTQPPTQTHLTSIPKVPYSTPTYPNLYPRSKHPKLIRVAPNLPPPIKTIGYKLGFDLTRFGDYQLIVPQQLKLGVNKVDIDQLIPQRIVKPSYAYTQQPEIWRDKVKVKDAEEILNMREAGRLAKSALELAGSLCVVGKSTLEIDTAVRGWIIDNGAYPSPLNYLGFPNSICTSVNNVICHGIPDGRQLQDGDLINVDVTVYLKGVHADTSATFVVGEVDPKGVDLVKHTQRSLELGIHVCGPHVPFNLIGRTIERYATQHGYTVSKDLTGHGIGTQFHEAPLIFHHDHPVAGVMQPGMTFTIEPILCQGVSTGTFWPDGWTIVTMDGGRSAQFEHTVLITSNGVEVLTA